MAKSSFMVAVAAIIENNNGEILLIKRNSQMDYPNCWEDVGGRLKQSETPEEGLRREILEETSIEDIEIVKPLTVSHAFRKDEKKTENEVMIITFWCKTNSLKISLSLEHSDYKWVTISEAYELAGHPALKKNIIKLVEEKNG